MFASLKRPFRQWRPHQRQPLSLRAGLFALGRVLTALAAMIGVGAFAVMGVGVAILHWLPTGCWQAELVVQTLPGLYVAVAVGAVAGGARIWAHAFLPRH